MGGPTHGGGGEGPAPLFPTGAFPALQHLDVTGCTEDVSMEGELRRAHLPALRVLGLRLLPRLTWPCLVGITARLKGSLVVLEVCGCPELHDVVLDFPLRKPWSGHLGTAALTTLAPVDVGARDTQLEQSFVFTWPNAAAR